MRGEGVSDKVPSDISSLENIISEGGNLSDENGQMMGHIIDELPGGVAVIRLTDVWECRYFNDGFAALSGRSRDEFNNALKNQGLLKSMVYQPDLKRLTDSISKVGADGVPVNLTFRFYTKDGQLKWTHMAANRLHDENGCPLYYCVFSEPSDEAAMYRNIVENSSTGVTVIEKNTQRIIYANKKICELYRSMPPEFITGKRLPALIIDRDSFLSDNEIRELPYDNYWEIHRVFEKSRHFCIRTKSLIWNDIESFVAYVVDETTEFNKNIMRMELLDRVPAGIGILEIINGKANLVYFNDDYYRMIGVDRKLRNGKGTVDFMRFIESDDRPVLDSAFENIKNGINFGHIDIRILCGDDAYHWFRINGSVISREDNRIRTYCSFADFDEIMSYRKSLENANAAIRESYEHEKLKHEFLERKSIATFTLNLSKKALIESRATMELSAPLPNGTDMESCLSIIGERIPVEKERQALEECFDPDRAERLLRSGKTERSAVVRLRGKEGDLHWIRIDSELQKQKENDDLLAFVYISDVDAETKRRMTIESVIDKDTEYVTILSAVTGKAMLLQMKEGYASHRKDAYEEFDFDNFCRNVADIEVLPEDKDRTLQFYCVQNLKNALETENITNVLFRHIHNDGSIRRKRTQAYYLDEMREDIVIVCRDVTDIYEEEQRQKKQLQEAYYKASRASQAKSEFMSNMSHDIRTPLNAVLGFAELAKDVRNVPEEAMEYLKQIDSSGKYLLSLINDILDMSRIENGKMQLYEVSVNWPKFLEKTSGLFRTQAAEKGISFVTDFPTLDSPWVIMDELRTNQIYANLLSNAIKFSHSGTTIKWSVQVVKTGFDGFHVTSRVTDQGCGMSKEFMEKMFLPFEQGSPENASTGTGLGLAIVENIVTAMGGSIRAESTKGRGSEFIIEIDRKYGRPQKIKRSEKDAGGSLIGRRILLCEDNQINTVVAVKLLEKMGCKVDCEANGKLGLERFAGSKVNTYDAILMDIRMPEMDGLEATERIRALGRPESATIPIIAMSANAFEEDIRKSLNAGMNAHLSKPIDVDALYRELAKRLK